MLSYSFCPPAARLRLAVLVLAVCAVLTAAAPSRAQSSQDPIYVFHTSLGDMRVQLFPDVAPKTVANFLSYVGTGAYSSSFFHRSVPGFVVQGGGFTADSQATVATIPTHAPVVNEFHLSNTRGTIAMAKVGSDPNSATDQWFFNEGDNSANLDNQNGGFTVFGKIVDAASLAVMDRIAGVQVYNEGSPFDQIPLVNYQSGSKVVQSNFVLISAITPAWTAVSAATGPDGSQRLLWNRGDGAMTVWALTSEGVLTAQTDTYGPYEGWTAKALSIGPDNSAHVLWTNVDGRMTLWTFSAAGTLLGSTQNYGPYAGWQAVALATGINGFTHVLWNNTDGRATPWNFDAQSRLSGTFPVFGPYAGWTAQSISASPDGSTHLLWDNQDGRMTVWTMGADNVPTATSQFGPYAGWSAIGISSAMGISSGADVSTHVLWSNTDGRMTLWAFGATNVPTSSRTFGPYAGWGAVSISVAPDGSMHVLWDNANGQITLWHLTPQAEPTGSFPTYGPY